MNIRVLQTRRTTRVHVLPRLFRDSSGSSKLLRDGDDFDEGAAGFQRWLRPSDIAVVLNLDLDICRLGD